LADRKGIKPGDSVVFEEATDDAILLRKAGSFTSSKSPGGTDYERVRQAIEEFAKDLPKIRKRLKESGPALNENLSRHVTPK